MPHTLWTQPSQNLTVWKNGRKKYRSRVSRGWRIRFWPIRLSTKARRDLTLPFIFAFLPLHMHSRHYCKFCSLSCICTLLPHLCLSHLTQDHGANASFLEVRPRRHAKPPLAIPDRESLPSLVGPWSCVCTTVRAAIFAWGVVDFHGCLGLPLKRHGT